MKTEPEEQKRKQENDIIRVKKSYIYIPLPLVLAYWLLELFFLWFLFLTFYLYLGQKLKIPLVFTLTSWEFILATISSFILSLPTLFLTKLLKRFTKKWKYAHFAFMQQFARTLTFLIGCYWIGFYMIVIFWSAPLPLWSMFLTFLLLVMFCYIIPLIGFFSITGQGVLSLRLFMREFSRNPDNADFGRLTRGLKKISNITTDYNMKISPYKLSLAITVSLIEKKVETLKDIEQLIGWLENPTDPTNFTEFRKLNKKYNDIAKQCSKEGITQKSHLTIEEFLKVFGILIIPILVSVPKILEIFGFI